MHTTTYTHLRVSTLNEEAHEKTCNYWYTVTTWAISLTAFNKRENFLKWLEYLGLSLDRDLPSHGTLGNAAIIGSYRECSHLNHEEFTTISPIYSIRVLSNGSWTEGKVTIDADGIHTVHDMNPNYKQTVFDYKESRKLYG